MGRSLIVVLVVSVLQFVSPLGAQDGLPRAASPERVGLSSSILDRVSNLVNRYIAEQKIAGGVLAVARNGETALIRAYGYQNLPRGMAMSTETIFRIYSMSKPVTAVAVMILHEEGHFDLDDPVAEYLPEFERLRIAENGETRPPVRPVTIRDLLLHTSGLSHRTSRLYTEANVRDRSRPLNEFIDAIVDVPLAEDPGTRFRYSEAPTVLGRLVEVWSGQPLDVFMQERIFEPLGMVDTGFHVPDEDYDRLATVYRYSVGMPLEPVELEAVPFSEPPALLEGAVGLVSTVPDYLRFAQMLLNRGEIDGVRILEAESVQFLTTNGLSDELLDARGGGFGWSPGSLNVLMDPATVDYPAGVGEFGWSGSAGTVFWVDPQAQLIAILMTQVQPADPDRLWEDFRTHIGHALIASGT